MAFFFVRAVRDIRERRRGLDNRRRSSERAARNRSALVLSDLLVGLVAPLGLHRGAFTTVLHHREVVTYGATGGGAKDRMMADVVAADTADDRPRETSSVCRTGAS